jgi:hypothetical protein
VEQVDELREVFTPLPPALAPVVKVIVDAGRAR